MEDTVPPGPPSGEEPAREPQAPEGPGEPEQVLTPGAIAFLTLGIAVALSVAAGAGIGYLVDSLVHTAPLFTLIGLALGVAVAVAMTVTQVRRYL